MKHKPQSLTSWVTLGLLAVSAIGIVIGPLYPVSLFAKPQQVATESGQSTDSTKPVSGLTTSSLSSDQGFEGIGTKLDSLD